MYMYIYIYIERERERYIYIYIYTHTYPRTCEQRDRGSGISTFGAWPEKARLRACEDVCGWFISNIRVHIYIYIYTPIIIIVVIIITRANYYISVVISRGQRWDKQSAIAVLRFCSFPPARRAAGRSPPRGGHRSSGHWPRRRHRQADQSPHPLGLYIYIYMYIYIYIEREREIHIYIYIYRERDICIYIYIYIYIYIHRERERDCCVFKHECVYYIDGYTYGLWLRAGPVRAAGREKIWVKMLEPWVRRPISVLRLWISVGFDSSGILVVRGGTPRPLGNFPESLSQAILVGTILVGRLGVPRTKESCRGNFKQDGAAPSRIGRHKIARGWQNATILLLSLLVLMMIIINNNNNNIHIIITNDISSPPLGAIKWTPAWLETEGFAEYSTVQYSTVQYSTVQYSIV